MTDWRKQFETKEFDRSARPAKVCFSWTSLESFVQEIQANERAKVIAEVDGWLVDEKCEVPNCPYRHDLSEIRNKIRAELRAKLAEMKGGKC